MAKELAVLYDNGDGDSALFVFRAGGNYFEQAWRSVKGGLAWKNCQIAMADVRNSGKAELCVLYNFGGGDTALFVLPEGGSHFEQLWRSGKGTWGWEVSQFSAADVRNTGKAELCVLYNYGGDDTALFVFPAGGTNFQQAWRSGIGRWAWEKSQIVAADVRNSGKTELCALYDHGGDDTALFVFPAGGTNFQQAWRSGKGRWAWENSQIASADVRNSGKTELCALYDHGGDDTALFVFPAGGTSFQQAWRSGKGNWRWENSKVAGAAVRNVGKAELCVLYNYGDSGTALFVFPTGGNHFEQLWRSGKDGLAWNKTLLEAGKPMSSPSPAIHPTGPYCLQAFSEDGRFTGQLTILADSYDDAQAQANYVVAELGGEYGFLARGVCDPLSLPCSNSFNARIYAHYKEEK
jgi:hypothetical protein